MVPDVTGSQGAGIYILKMGRWFLPGPTGQDREDSTGRTLEVTGELSPVGRVLALET